MKIIKVDNPLVEANKSAMLVAVQLGQTVSVVTDENLPFVYIELYNGKRLARFERK